MNRRTVALLVVACLVVGVVGTLGRDLVRDLVSGAFSEPVEPARPLSPAEAQRLASMRQHNWQDARAGVRATIGSREGALHAVGWVDWRRPAVYLALSGDQPGVVTELVQAVPGLIASRPMKRPGAGSPAATAAPSGDAIVDPHPPPPARPPTKGWRLRHPAAAGTAVPAGGERSRHSVDTLVTLLFTIAAETPDAADVLARSESQWLRHDRAGGHDVDVLLGPAIPPAAVVSPTPTPPESPTSPSTPPAVAPSASTPPASTPSASTPSASTPSASTPSAGAPPTGTISNGSLATMGGAVQYWLDGKARLHRLDALLARDTPLRIDFDRTDRTVPPVLDVLGGPAVDPRPVTRAEAATLAALRPRNLAAGGGEVTMYVPSENGTVRATGWLDWQRTIAYLALSGTGCEPDQQPCADGNADGVVYADPNGVASRAGAGLAAAGYPPLPVPDGDGWEWSPWQGRGDERGGFDLDLLLNEALALSGYEEAEPETLRETAAWLRTDQLSGTPVAVYEIPRSFESEVAPGAARMRYWVDGDGVLRRLEIRTRSGAFGHLDLTPGEVPLLSPGA